jgi:hypothetical protein
MPVLALVDVPPPPGWDLFRDDVRAAYLLQLEAVGLRVAWPVEREVPSAI